MARTRYIGVLLVVATLLLWGSAAAATTSLSMGGGAVDASSTAQVQQQDDNVTVTFEDQTVENGSVTVENVTVPEGGYVAIHNDSLRDGQAVSSVIGVSEYLEPGTHENVTVTLYENVSGAEFENATQPEGSETLIAVAYTETSEQMADNETTTGGAGDNQTTTDDGTNDTQTNDTETTTTDDGTNDTETTTDDGGMNDTETTTEDGGMNDTETTTEDGGMNDTETTTADDDANDTETTTEDGGTDDTETTEDGDANDTETTTGQNDTQQGQTFDYVATDGEEDSPYRSDGAVVSDSAQVEFSAPATDGGAGGGAAPDTDDTQTNDTQTNDTQAESSLVVEDIEAPALAASNSTITVNATISNSADEEATEDVAFRLAGDDADVVVHEEVSVDASGNETVNFELEASEVGEGEYIHGVTTQNSSAFATIEVTDDAQVVMGDQEMEGDSVTVESVYLPEGGYVALHDGSLVDGDAVGSVVGSSEYLEAGVHENVTVTLSEDGAAQENETTQDNQTTEDETTTDDAQNDTTTAEDNTTEDDTTTQDDTTEDTTTEDNTTQAGATQDDQTLIAMAHQETTDNENFEFVESDGEDDGPYTTDGEAVVDVGNLTVTAEDSPSGSDEDSTDN